MDTMMKKILVLALSAALVLGCSGAAFAKSAPAKQNSPKAAPAITPEELTADGETGTVYVLTDAEGVVQRLMSGEQDVDTQAPVEITVRYELDGESVTPEALAGKSGHLKLTVDFAVTETVEAEIEGKAETLTVPYAVVTGLVLDNTVASDVTVTNGRLFSDGSRTLAVGLALPGLREDLQLEDEDRFEIPDRFELEAEVTDFSVDMILCAATKEIFRELDTAKLDDLGELDGKMDDLTGGMAQLLSGAVQLRDGLKALQDGASTLSDGVGRVKDGASAIAQGAAQLETGAGQVKDGAAALSAGLAELDGNSASLVSGAEQVFNALLSTANTQLAAAGLTVPQMTIANYADVLNAVIASLDPDAVYAAALEQVTAAVEANRPAVVEAVTAAVRTQVEAKVTAAVRAQVEAGVTAAVRAQVEAGVTAAVRAQVRAAVIQSVLHMTAEEYDAAVAAGLVDEGAQSQIEAAVEAQMASENVQTLIAQNVEAQMATGDVQALIVQSVEAKMASEDVQALIAQNVEAQMASEDVQALIAQNVEAKIAELISENMQSEAVQAKLAAASEGAQSVIALKTSLDSYNAFYLGVKAYTAGVGEAAKGADALTAGAASLLEGAEGLSEGASALKTGTAALNDGLPALTDGIDRLYAGAEALADGLAQFNSDGVQKLADLFTGDLKPLAERLRAALEASDTGSDLRFIYRIEGVG